MNFCLWLVTAYKLIDDISVLFDVVIRREQNPLYDVSHTFDECNKIKCLNRNITFFFLWVSMSSTHNNIIAIVFKRYVI